MRWDALFADLQAELDAEAEAERRSEVTDRIRAELGRLRLIDRLRPMLPAPGDPAGPGGPGAPAGTLRLGLAGHEAATGVLQALGADWLLLAQDAGGHAPADVLVPLAALQWIQGLGHRSAEPGWEGAVGARLSLRVALRRIVRDRSTVLVALTSGGALQGRLARVGAEYVELDSAEPAGRVAPSASTIPFGAIASVRRR
jgi:hypothetical protein